MIRSFKFKKLKNYFLDPNTLIHHNAMIYKIYLFINNKLLIKCKFITYIFLFSIKYILYREKKYIRNIYHSY